MKLNARETVMPTNVLNLVQSNTIRTGAGDNLMLGCMPLKRKVSSVLEMHLFAKQFTLIVTSSTAAQSRSHILIEKLCDQLETL